jgi:hypothetical protein
MRKALFVSTGGASGLFVKANSKKERTAKALEKQTRLMQRQGTAMGMVAPVVPVADELTKLAALRDQKVITDAEFEAQKRRLLAGQQETAQPEDTSWGARLGEKHPLVFPYVLVTIVVLFLVIGGYWGYGVAWGVFLVVSLPLLAKHNQRKIGGQAERLTAATLAQHKAERDANKAADSNLPTTEV